MKLHRVKLLTPENPNKATAILNGKSSGILNWDDIKYPQMYEIYKKLLGNFWTPFEINMTEDSRQYKQLREDEREAFRNIIGLLAILDSIQPKFLSILQDFLTDDSIRDILIVMAQQEVVHNHSYSYILSSVETKNMQDLAFQAARTKKEVFERNKLITDLYEDAVEQRTLESLMKALSASVILEGINFYSGFAFFYNLARNQKMVGASTMISYINKDELVHTYLITQLIKLLIQENKDEIAGFEYEEFTRDLFKKAVELEIEWSNTALVNTEDIDLNEMADYIKYRANKCLSMMGFAPVYEGVDENSMTWIKAYTDEGESRGATKTDFFEQKPRSYAKITEDNGFDDL